ncbi:MAG: electron transport complex subunit E [Peptococcia bacterium]
MSLFKEFSKGLIRENPLFSLLLGLCASLAVTTTVENALGMGIALTFVLIGSNVVISLLRKVIPDNIRIPCYIVVIATFVTILEMFMHAYFPALYTSLGIFVPLIVVNCIILGRAEAFAGKKGVLLSLIDGLGMGVGYTLALFILGTVREVLGSGTFMGYSVMSQAVPPTLIMILPPGAFITLAIILAIINKLQEKRA